MKKCDKFSTHNIELSWVDLLILVTSVRFINTRHQRAQENSFDRIGWIDINFVRVALFLTRYNIASPSN